MSKKQSLKNGTKVIFYNEGISFEEWEELEMGDIFKKECQTAEILSLEAYTELGDKDYEYYNIKFGDGTEFDGVSGYHLEEY